MISCVQRSKSSYFVQKIKASDANNTNRLLIDCDKTINVLSPLSVETNSKIPRISDALGNCEKFVIVSDKNLHMQVPDEKVYSKLSSL